MEGPRACPPGAPSNIDSTVPSQTDLPDEKLAKRVPQTDPPDWSIATVISGTTTLIPLPTDVPAFKPPTRVPGTATLEPTEHSNAKCEYKFVTRLGWERLF